MPNNKGRCDGPAFFTIGFGGQLLRDFCCKGEVRFFLYGLAGLGMITQSKPVKW